MYSGYAVNKSEGAGNPTDLQASSTSTHKVTEEVIPDSPLLAPLDDPRFLKPIRNPWKGIHRMFGQSQTQRPVVSSDREVKSHQDPAIPAMKFSSDGREMIYNKNSCLWVKPDPIYTEPLPEFPPDPTQGSAEGAYSVGVVDPSAPNLYRVKRRRRRERKPPLDPDKPFDQWDFWSPTL